MALSIRISPVEHDIEATINNDLSPQAQGQAIGKFVRDGIADADQTNQRVLGHLPPRTITVDGATGGSVENVNPDGGSIIVEWDIVTDVLIWIAQTLIDRSPSISGAYKRGHILLADGQEVQPGNNIPQADEYTFINLVPYARKIEIGKTEKGRSFVIQVPNRIYERTAIDARARFSNIADIQFDYRAASNAYTLKHNQAARHFRKGGRIYIEPSQRSDRVAGSAVPSPAIIVRLKNA